MKGYKAFEKGLVCKGKQYAENTIFEEENAKVCECGMHFCENPLDVLDYYPLIDDNGELTEYAEVEALDEVFTDDNKKYCTKKLKIGAKLDLPAFVKASIDFQFEKTPIKKTIKKSKSASGNYSKLAASGDYSKLAASGNSSKLAASGDSSKLAASGNSSKLAASGNYSKLAASGDYSQLAASGNSSKLAASGNSSKLAASGDYSKLAASGNYSKLAASGDYSKLAASGDSSQLAASGDYSKLAASGNSSVVVGIGVNNIAKAVKGCWITLAEWKYDSEKGATIPVCVKTEYVDGEKIKENVFYKLVDGEFTEVEE